MSKKVLNYAGRRPMLLALIMATIVLGLLFSGWLTPMPGKAQPSQPNPQPNGENTNCVPTTNAWSGSCPSIVTNGSVSPTSIYVCYSNAPTMPTDIIQPIYSPTNIFTQIITYSTTNCTPVTNTENVTYSVGGVFWTNFSGPYTNFPAHVTNTFSANADVYVTSSDTNVCPSPGLVSLGSCTWNVSPSCGGTCYDPTTQGCCSHGSYDSSTGILTFTYHIYNLATQCCAQDGSILDKYNISDLSKCPNKTTRPPPYVPLANGCGSATGPSSITPNCPTILTAWACYAVGINWCFTDPCNAHDRGYGTCNTPKDVTDQKFFNDMTDVCDNLVPSSPLCRAACREDAAIYYDAVHYGGHIAYDDSQKAACICCP